jgi:hypothetical protein
MESKGAGFPKAEDRAVPAYSFARIAVVIFFGQVAGVVGAVFLFVIMFAPCGIPITIIQNLFGEVTGLLVVFSLAGGFASGCFINLQIPRVRWRFILLFCGNPTFLLFVLAVVLVRMDRAWTINGIVLNTDSLHVIALFLALGTLTAVLGDWYTWRRAERAGVR